MPDASLLNHPLDCFLRDGDVLHVAADGQMVLRASLPVKVLLPGSFNPIHRGHWALARLAEQILGQPAAFELSVVNVDKPNLTRDEIRRRLVPFNWQASVWLTHAAKFVHKAEGFPGVTFVVGADTALRLVLPRYYESDEARMTAALGRIRELECRFLVACRLDGEGKCVGAGDLPIPTAFREMFTEIPAQQFRWDLSSTDLRTTHAPGHIG